MLNTRGRTSKYHKDTAAAIIRYLIQLNDIRFPKRYKEIADELLIEEKTLAYYIRVFRDGEKRNYDILTKYLYVPDNGIRLLAHEFGSQIIEGEFVDETFPSIQLMEEYLWLLRIFSFKKYNVVIDYYPFPLSEPFRAKIRRLEGMTLSKKGRKNL